MGAVEMRMFPAEMSRHAVVAREGPVATRTAKVASLRMRHFVSAQVGALDEGCRASWHVAVELAS